MNSDKHDIRYIRYVHRPYRRPDKFSPATAKQRFDHTRVYRILTENSSGDLVDVSRPMNKVIDGTVIDWLSYLLFYVGAEDDLDRYLRWLNNVGLAVQDDKTRPIYVLEQYTEDVLNELVATSSHKNITPQMLFPGQLDTILILSDMSNGKSRKISMY